MRGSDIWLLTERDAPRGRVVHVKAAAPAFSGAREVVPQGKALMRALFAARDAVYVQELDGGVGRLRKFSGRGGGGTVSSVKLPFEGALTFIFADPRRDGVIAALESWVRPEEIIKVLPSGTTTPTAWVAKPPIDVSGFASEQVFATAKDGTRIPVSVVYKKGTPRDGSAPTMIDAYGSYAVSSDPYFAPRFIAWIERGGVWATAHVRGGGEYGREWHEAGRLLNKPNTWRDLIAAAELLVEQRWTSPSKLSIRGGSAGGITVGRALTERPDLFSAVISQVGVSNPLRAEFSQNGPPNVPEFGSVETENGFKGLYEMDAYAHVKDGERYPAVMLTTGITDPRVDPYQAAKMTARLQAATSSGKPVLLRVDYQAGHGLGSTRTQRDIETGDLFAFALWQAGVAGFQPGR
jgi:prolyl oligopeptidase